MDIFPAIDLKAGQCVRLAQGDFAAATIYASDPLAQAKAFEAAGAEWLHVVDLDGAKAGAMVQHDIITGIAGSTKLKVQTGGGIRDEGVIERLLAAGVKRVVIGSRAVSDPATVQGWMRRFGPDRITLAFDVRIGEQGPEVLTHGWQTGSRKSLWDLIDAYLHSSGLKSVLCTDISRDGMLVGANFELYRLILERWPRLGVLASGGVTTLDEVKALTKLGAAGAIIGKAIYEGRIDLKSALKAAKDAS